MQKDNKSTYLNKIEKIKEHIQRGDIYEMNYCQEFYAKEADVLAEDVFLRLNRRMKTPFSSFLKLKDKYVLSSSPERFLRKKGNQVLSQPIKGTRKRGLTDVEDAQLINSLKKSQKDISENILSKYVKRIFKEFANNHEKLYKIKEVIHKLSDDELNDIAIRVNKIDSSKRSLGSVFKTAVYKKPSLIFDVVRIFTGF